jgi:hypothetical protein
MTSLRYLLSSLSRTLHICRECCFKIEYGSLVWELNLVTFFPYGIYLKIILFLNKCTFLNKDTYLELMDSNFSMQHCWIYLCIIVWNDHVCLVSNIFNFKSGWHSVQNDIRIGAVGNQRLQVVIKFRILFFVTKLTEVQILCFYLLSKVSFFLKKSLMCSARNKVYSWWWKIFHFWYV